MSYDVDFYRPPRRRLTLLHTIAKYRLHEWSDEEKVHISRLIWFSNNLFLKNSMGSTFIRCGKNIGQSKANLEFMWNEVQTQITRKQCKIMFILARKVGQRQEKLNKYIARDIYKYID